MSSYSRDYSEGSSSDETNKICDADEDCNSNNSYNDDYPGNPSKPITNFNAFANDGSFLEIMKKKMEAQMKGGTSGTSLQTEKADQKKTPTQSLPIVGKRRGKILKTGMVKKQKIEDDASIDTSKDAWSRYLAEVKKYKQHACDDDSKTRPLVK